MGIRKRLRSRSIALGLAGVVVAAMTVLAGTTLSANAAGTSMGSMGSMGANSANTGVGTTKGWYRGKTLTFLYTRNYFCKEPPHSASGSGCEVGANFRKRPSHQYDPLYVIVPIGFTPPASTIQCPAGNCIDHPHRIDLRRVFGSGTGRALLPAHSHIVTTRDRGRLEWWDIKVIGVTSQKVWNQVVAHKGYGEINRLRAQHNTHVTANIPTNLFLYFAVRR